MFTINSKKEPPEVFCKKAVLKHFSILTGKCLCSSLFLITLRPFRSATFLKRDFNAGVFCEYCEILKNAYFKENRTAFERLLLNNVKQNYSSMKIVIQVLNVSQHSQENTITGVSFLINIVVACNLSLKEVPGLVFS